MWALAPPPGHSLVPSHGDGWKEMASSRWTLLWGRVGQGGVGECPDESSGPGLLNCSSALEEEGLTLTTFGL